MNDQLLHDDIVSYFRDGHQGRVTTLGAEQGQAAEHGSDDEGEDQREVAEFGNHGLPLFEGLRGLVSAVDGVLGFGRHVVFIVLGQHFAGDEYAIGIELALGHGAFRLLEQVRQRAFVNDGQSLGRIGDREMHGLAIRFARQRTRQYHAANAEGPALRHLALGYFAGGMEEHKVVAESVQYQRSGAAEQGQGNTDEQKAFVAGFHVSPFPVAAVDGGVAGFVSDAGRAAGVPQGSG